MIKLIVFDFDGTLADTRTYLLDAIQAILKEFNYDFDYELLYTHLGDYTLAGTMSYLGASKKDLDIMIEKVLFRIEKKLEKVKPCPGVKDLAKIKQKKIILSNNFDVYIRDFFKKNSISFFDEIHAEEKLQPKFPRFRKIIQKENLRPKEILYIGDKVADAKLAKKIGCHHAIISHRASWSSLAEIKKAKPEFIITKLSDIQQVVNELNISLPKKKTRS